MHETSNLHLPLHPPLFRTIGETNFTPILKTLLKNGYKGYISVEVFNFNPDPQTIASRSIGYLKGILETLTETK